MIKTTTISALIALILACSIASADTRVIEVTYTYTPSPTMNSNYEFKFYQKVNGVDVAQATWPSQVNQADLTVDLTPGDNSFSMQVVDANGNTGLMSDPYILTYTPPDGAALYASNCSRCHGSIDTTNLRGRADAATISQAIASNRGGMGQFSTLNTYEIDAIASQLTAYDDPGQPVVKQIRLVVNFVQVP